MCLAISLIYLNPLEFYYYHLTISLKNEGHAVQMNTDDHFQLIYNFLTHAQCSGN